MNGTLSLPPGLVMRDLLLSGFSKRRLIFILVACVMVLGLQIALSVEPNYKAKSTLLVLLGTEHSFRPPAGQQFLNSGGVDAEQVLRTEAGILASDDLHRSVIREIGIEHLYPKLLKPPSTFARWMNAAKLWIAETTGNTALNQPDGTKNDPLARAVDQFAENLSINVDRKSSVIELDFTNPDPTVASDALKVLEHEYFALRSRLYGDVQAPIVKVQQEKVGQQLADSDNALATFKQQHDISSFADRRTILLKQQGDLETALAKSESTIAEQEARLKQLNQQLGTATGTKKGTPNASSALQGMVSAYRQRQADAQTHYRGSPAVDEARRQMLDRETDIAKMQATQAFGVQGDRNKTEADLRSSLAGHDAIEAQLDTLNKQVAALDAEELQLHSLERNRGILEDNYKAVSKILDERQVVETVESNRQSSVRVIQPPRVPAFPQPLRRLILLAAVVISVLLTAAVVLLSHFFRASYLRPEALEFDTGLAVLASVPETKALGRSNLLVTPG
ncbi:MAG TPA: hypothetical protein VIG49_13395 [Acetobacteraceae bacterium]|jgi:uncharacterized protein involved in exopolysaccharide biosynthesis